MGQTILNIILGLLGITIAVVVVIYIKMFIAKLFNVKVVDRSGRHLYDAESFDNVNSLLKEKIIPIKKNASLSTSFNKNINLENESNFTNIKLLNSGDVKAIMEKRTTIPREAIGKSGYLVIDRITHETNFLDKTGEQIYESNPPYHAIKKKLIFCNSNSGIEMQKIETRDILISAIKLEKEKDHEKANILFREYLNKVQFRFSLLSKNNIYTSINPGDTLIGLIAKYDTPRGEFLTADSTTIRYK